MHITQGTENSICPTNHFIFELLNRVLKFQEFWPQSADYNCNFAWRS